MKTTVVCGLLGSGKTTFIRNLLKVKGASEKTVVLVNDFGSVGIDGEILSAEGIETVELPSGCVCCALKFDLITTTERVLKTFNPAHLVIEPSGVASPSGVLEALELLKLLPVTVIGIVDASEFIELYESGMYGRYFKDQIKNSTVLLINKSDLADAETLDRISDTLESMNPFAPVLRAVNAVPDSPLPGVPELETVAFCGNAHFHFETLSFGLKAGITKAFVEDLFASMASGRFGRIVRAKALANTDTGALRVDYSYGKTDSEAFGGEVKEGRLVVIGEGLDHDSLFAAIYS